MDTNEVKTENVEKTYTQEEVNEMLQKEGDRRVSQALKKKEAELSESAKLANMNEQEKVLFKLDQREKEIAERERLVKINENKYEASKILSDKGLPVAFAEFVVTEDADTTRANIKTVEKAFNAAVAEKVKAQIGTTPTVGVANTQPMTKADFFKLPLAEQQRIYSSNPDLYNSLVK